MRYFRIAKDINHKNIDCDFAHSLTWNEISIDKAYKSYKKLFPDCVIVLVEYNNDNCNILQPGISVASNILLNKI